jgi:hypothetical protein
MIDTSPSANVRVDNVAMKYATPILLVAPRVGIRM